LIEAASLRGFMNRRARPVFWAYQHPKGRNEMKDGEAVAMRTGCGSNPS